MEDFDLNLDNLLSADELARLSGNFNFTDESQENSGEPETKENNINIHKPTVENPQISDLFDGSESVDSGENGQAGEDTANNNHGISPNIYSSIAKDYKSGGIFSHLDDKEIENIDSIEKFKDAFDDAIEKEIESRFTDAQKRVNEALNVGVEPTQIQKFEQTMSYLDNITEDMLNDESDSALELRKNLIYADYLNKGVSQERAKRLTEKSVENGTDIDDAIEALDGNKQFYRNAYNKIISDAKSKAEKTRDDEKTQIDNLRKSILEDDELLNGIKVDSKIRQKIVDNVSKATYRDPNTGNYLTPLQKWSMENKSDFMKIIGTLYTLTDGFKSFDKIVNSEINKINKKSLSNLADTINNTTRNADGSFRYVSGVSNDKNSYYGSNDWTLDLS